MNQKGFAPLLIVILIAALIGGYFIYQKQFKSSPQQTESLPSITSNNESSGSTETTNWKTHINKDYGFSFKYPSKFTLKEDKYIDDPIKGKVYYFWFYISENGVDEYSGYSISIHKSPGKTILQEFPQEFRQQAPGIPVKTLQNTQGADEAASAESTEDGYQSGIRYFRVKDNFFEISPIHQDSRSRDKIWNYPILDTFKFSPDETTVWRTYTNSQIGITAKYPSDWTVSQSIFISQVPFTAGKQDKTKTYNMISFQKYSTQIYEGLSNQQLFNKINDLNVNQSTTDQRAVETKLTSGATRTGESYVIFTAKPSSTFIGDSFDQVKAYIMKGQTIYQITLDQYNSSGLDVFKRLIPSISITTD